MKISTLKVCMLGLFCLNAFANDVGLNQEYSKTIDIQLKNSRLNMKHYDESLFLECVDDECNEAFFATNTDGRITRDISQEDFTLKLSDYGDEVVKPHESTLTFIRKDMCSLAKPRVKLDPYGDFNSGFSIRNMIRIAKSVEADHKDGSLGVGEGVAHTVDFLVTTPVTIVYDGMHIVMMSGFCLGFSAASGLKYLVWDLPNKIINPARANDYRYTYLDNDAKYYRKIAKRINKMSEKGESELKRTQFNEFVYRLKREFPIE